MTPEVGRPAPDFTLPSTSGRDVTLSAHRGTEHVLLAFFPLAFTGTCTAELSWRRAATATGPSATCAVPRNSCATPSRPGTRCATRRSAAWSS